MPPRPVHVLCGVHHRDGAVVHGGHRRAARLVHTEDTRQHPPRPRTRTRHPEGVHKRPLPAGRHTHPETHLGELHTGRGDGDEEKGKRRKGGVSEEKGKRKKRKKVRVSEKKKRRERGKKKD